MLKKIIQSTALAGISLVILLSAGCSVNGEPRRRLGSYPASALPPKFRDINSLGKHSYGSFLFEKNGLVYTGRGGHIDIAHLRIAADNTRSLYRKIREHLLNNDEEFTFKLNVEPSRYYVTMGYPAYWREMPEEYREKTAEQISTELSQYFTYTMTTWHEVLTWFGFKCLFFLPEKSSAFSWEDIYSNLIGTRLGAEAIADKSHDYNEAMTILLKKELLVLDIQSKRTAKLAANKMKDEYFNGSERLDITRSMDIGLRDGFVTPVLADEICEGAEPKPYPVPKTELANKLGFTVNLRIEPKEFESRRILKLIYPDGEGSNIRPSEHLPIVMAYIEKDAKRQGFLVRPSEASTYSTASIEPSGEKEIKSRLRGL